MSADVNEPGETLPALDWRDLMKDFYQVFSRDLEKATTEMKRVNEDAQTTEHPCPTCGTKMRPRQ